MSPANLLSPFVSAAIRAAFGPSYADEDPVLRPSQFADIQSNAALALSKRLRLPPRDVAAQIVQHLDVSGVCEKLEVSGPGFINFSFSDGWISNQVTAISRDPRSGVASQQARRIVIDYSAPNVAKEMHVGHLRTTVVGDALARTLEHLGHKVIRQNHIGDWGTPFGMLIEHLLEVGESSADAHLLEIDPNAFYQAARAKFEADTQFAARARLRVVSMQAGDPNTLRLWRELVDHSTQYFDRVYSRLGMTLTYEDLAGESSYNDGLADICRELEASGIATTSEGALCVFLEEFSGRDGKPVPLIIRKSDGGYLYGTTDLAAIKHRVEQLHADCILYVVGAPQSLHLRMVSQTARKAGWLPDHLRTVHVEIGNVLGEDRKILRTRSGAPLRLMALLDEAEAKASTVINAARPNIEESARIASAPIVAIGAVKYADLSVAHDSDYVFDLDRMVAMQGNTGPYLQYATTRIRSIFRTAGVDLDDATGTIYVDTPAERRLALALMEFGATTEQVGEKLEPHRLCSYLYELAQSFTTFYENCPVLQSSPEMRHSRLALCSLTYTILATGLDLLGIAVPEQM